MTRTIVVMYFLLFVVGSVSSQSLKGIVLDQKTNLPIESAAVYFDGTSIGTSTNATGEFKIELVQGVTSPLIISFLGYKKTILSAYDSGKFYKILMSEDLNTLDEVVISTDDGMSRELKLNYFRREFLGSSKNGQSCKILNESDLILRFNEKTHTLTANAKKPVQVENDNLRYRVAFDIQDFEIVYNYNDSLQRFRGIKSVTYTGSTFYSDLDSVNSKRTLKKRDKVYEGSVLHFMRALSKEQLKEEEYQIFKGSFMVPTYKYITVTPVENSSNVMVNISERLIILYDKKRQSIIEVNADGFFIDPFGNYAPIANALFGGDMGAQRIGDSLPFDYQLIENR